MRSNYRLVIVDDHAIVREGIRAVLAREADIEVVGEAANGKDALRCVASEKAEIVIMDLSLPHTNGTEAIAKIKRRFPETKVIVLTLHKAEEYVRAALDAGASGYVLKDDSHHQLIAAIQTVRSGKTFLSPSICGNVVTGYLKGSRTEVEGSVWVVLTSREREVIKLIAEGYRNKEIAEYLSLSPKTIEKHRSNSMKKLRLRNVAGITAYAIENGLTVLGTGHSREFEDRLPRN